MSKFVKGDRVDVVIGSEFTPNGVGKPVTIPDRFNGEYQGKDQYGNCVVVWPNGQTFTYTESILERVARTEPAEPHTHEFEDRCWCGLSFADWSEPDTNMEVERG